MYRFKCWSLGKFVYLRLLHVDSCCRCPKKEFHASKFPVSFKLEVDDVDLGTAVHILVADFLWLLYDQVSSCDLL